MDMIDESAMPDGHQRKASSWLERRPAFVPVLASIAFLQAFQGLFMALKFGSLGQAAAVGLASFGILVAPVTMLLLLPLILWLRRYHPAWRSGDRQRASWAVSFGLAAALAGWMVADQAVASVGISPLVEPWIEGLFAMAVGWAAAGWVEPPTAGLRAGAVFVPFALLAAVLAPTMIETPGPKATEPADDPPSEVELSPAPAGSPDVVLVTIDTLRADRLGAYGRSPSITPEMDRLADEGVVFGRTLAAAPWTIPSVASMLTGLPTVRHRAGRSMGSGLTFARTPLDEDLTTLAERFAAAGYRTRAVSANGFVSQETGMAQGFEVFENPFTTAIGSGVFRDLPLSRLVLSLIPDRKLGDYRAAGVTDQALAWLAEDDAAPIFLWVHYLGPHIPLRAEPDNLDLEALQAMVHESLPTADEDGSVLGEVFTATSHVRSGLLWLSPLDRRKLEDRYDLTVSYVDQHVGRLFTALRERHPEIRPVVAALTSDHGEELWDHGHFEHGHDYYREVTRVPLIFWSPGRVPAGLHVSSLAGHVDIGPTLLELAELAAPRPSAPDEGRSLAPRFRPQGDAADAGDGTSDSEEPPHPAAPPRFSGGNLYGLPAALVEDGSWRFILRANGQGELYNVELDPQERHNVALQNPQIADRYRQLLEPRLATLLEDADDEEAELSTETLEALRSLGYVN